MAVNGRNGRGQPHEYNKGFDLRKRETQLCIPWRWTGSDRALVRHPPIALKGGGGAGGNQSPLLSSNRCSKQLCSWELCD